MAVSLFEAQMRDCLRLSVDSRYSQLDYKSEFLDIKIDAGLFDHMRARRLSLGEFVFINTGISTIERLWQAVTFCFPYVDEKEFLKFIDERKKPRYTFAELKTSIAWVYVERNRYVHEFFDDAAGRIGADQTKDFFVHLSRALDFLHFMQFLKNSNFTKDYAEHHPRWGETGKAINRTQRRIDRLVQDIYAFFQSLPDTHPDDIYKEGLRTSLANLLAIAEDYIRARAEFSYTSYGPGGTIRNDIAAAVTLSETKAFEKVLKRGYEDMQSYCTQ